MHRPSPKINSSAFVFAGIFVFLYILNYLHPLSFGDDYLYSFIWQGQPMNVPLSETAERVSSWKDIFASQRSHYFTWGGRTVAHILAQFFLWMGKRTFDFFNAFISVILVAEIYWCIHKGKILLNFKPKTVCWIFFVLWAFTPGFSPVFLWLTAACNYLWTSVILIAFLLLYIQKYYCFSKILCPQKFFPFLMLLFGIIAGWTNENSVCWIILILLFFVIKNRNNPKLEIWMISGLLGLIIGYSLLIFAPGNTARLYAEQSGGSNWLNLEAFKSNLQMFCSISFFQIFLWFFCLRALVKLRHLELPSEEIEKEIYMVKTLCVLAFAMTAIMFLSPGFPARSGFAGTVSLIIAAGLLLRVQDDYGIELILPEAKRFLLCVSIVYFVMTAGVTVHSFYNIHIQMEGIVVSAKQAAGSETVVIVPRLEKTEKEEDMFSGFHIPSFELSEDENRWENVAFARYYGIKGIRMPQKTNKDHTGKEHDE